LLVEEWLAEAELLELLLEGLVLLALVLVEDWLVLLELLLDGEVLDDDWLVLLELLLELDDEELDDEESVSAVNSRLLVSARVARARTRRFAFVLRCGFRFICQLSGVAVLADHVLLIQISALPNDSANSLSEPYKNQTLFRR